MNTPGTTADNWRWRFSWDQMSDGKASMLLDTIRLYGRDPQ